MELAEYVVRKFSISMVREVLAEGDFLIRYFCLAFLLNIFVLLYFKLVPLFRYRPIRGTEQEK